MQHVFSEGSERSKKGSEWSIEAKVTSLSSDPATKAQHYHHHVCRKLRQVRQPGQLRLMLSEYFPGAGDIVKAAQFGAAFVSAGVSMYGSVRAASLSATGAGLAIGEKTEVSIAVDGVKVIPKLGNAVSLVATGFDIFGEGGVVGSYKTAWSGHTHD